MLFSATTLESPTALLSTESGEPNDIPKSKMCYLSKSSIIVYHYPIETTPIDALPMQSAGRCSHLLSASIVIDQTTT
eukprot:scaffold24827_cov105-Skeletonema_dohrnii-CCMP3373.AAC.3